MNAPSDPRNNNFDFLRFFAASTVVFGHSFWLSGRGASEPVRLFTGSYDGADIAVHLFFVMSGYLIAASWLNSRSLIDFAGKRALRIFPALAVAVLFGVLVVGPLATRLPLADYWSEPQTLGYLGNIALLTQFQLPGVFVDNPFPNTVNGSLWTLPYEVMMYVSVVLLGVLGLFRRRMALLGLAMLFAIQFYLIPALDLQSELLRKFSRLGVFFYFGAVLYLYRQRIRWSWKIAVPLLAASLLSAGHDIWPLVHALTLPYLVIYLAHLRIPALAGFGKAGDFSYGLYIFSFPLQQLLMHWSAGSLPLLPFMLLGFSASLLAAVLSWHLIEAPALALKRHLPRGVRRATQPRPALAGTATVRRIP
ncbi:acetyltransferase [Stutzerimonas stutzeri TS44]|nr:acetyltransferase [Stutzerimonas stutzeri TS44]